MAYKIILSKRFNNKYEKLLSYLKTKWSLHIAKQFTATLYFRLDTLSKQPHIGKISSAKNDIRSILITKHNRIYYKIDGDTITVVNMFDTRINPKKKSY